MQILALGKLQKDKFSKQVFNNINILNAKAAETFK